MLLRRIELKNIRSYNDGEDVTVDLPEGVVLFEGDIGSGKSTLLYAVEFALFGLSDVKGGHLLSEGKNEGYVKIAFEADGKEYIVRRGLRRRGADVVQEGCHVVTDGSREILSPSDLKQRIVAVLRFNEPTHPRAESLVYRFAVFTPQEQMKEILLQNVETRFQVLRRVLGVQSYEVAADNSGLVAKKIGDVSHGLRMASADLEEARTDLKTKTATVEGLDARLPELEAAEARAAGTVQELESQWRGLRDKREEVREITGKIPVIEERARDLTREKADATEKLRRLEERLRSEFNPAVESFSSRHRPPKGRAALEAELQVTRKELQVHREAKAVAEAQLNEAGDLISKGVCPVCGQAIPPDFARSSHAQEEYGELSNKVSVLEALTLTIAGQVDEARTYEEDERTVSVLTREKTALESEANGLRARLEEVKRDLLESQKELEDAKREALSITKLSEDLTRLDGDLTAARSAASMAGIALAQARTQREDLAGECERLQKTVATKEALRSRAQTLGSYEGWLDDFFLPTIGMIEEQTLTLANSRFNHHFQRFFTTLVDDRELTVRVKEDFTPVFEREGFEQDYEALSGGERTSMALAYRFALNSVVREDISAKTELVILDEPTDGFSKEQVYKMRNLLEELDARQVILVSHERELESMADHIFRVVKSGGTSRIARP